MVPQHCRSTFGCRAFSVAGPREWNSLPKSPVYRQLQIGTLIFSQREGTISALEALRDALVVVASRFVYKSTTILLLLLSLPLPPLPINVLTDNVMVSYYLLFQYFEFTL